MSSVILFDTNSQVDGIDSMGEPENCDFQKNKRGEKGEGDPTLYLHLSDWDPHNSHCPM